MIHHVVRKLRWFAGNHLLALCQHRIDFYQGSAGPRGQHQLLWLVLQDARVITERQHIVALRRGLPIGLAAMTLDR